MPREHLHFVTGRLAEFALRAVVTKLAVERDFAYTIDVLPITVAALMSPAWIARHIQVAPEATRVILPGYCHGDLAPLTALTTVPLQIGPRDLQLLPEFLGGKNQRPAEYGRYDIQIIAEINHAPRQPLAEIIHQAKSLADDGADFIDVGCDPGGPWLGVADCVKALREEGLRVSIDSLDPREIAPAVRAGAELVLSVNSSNRAAACDWGCEVVVIPDDFPTLVGLEGTIELLAEAKVPLRVDAVLEPIGFGFAASLGRYLEVRRRYPDVEMMMGIGNLTELTDSDSAGINTLLLGFCQELGIRSVLTTQVINWARTSVRECDLARRLVYHAVQQRVPPKRLEPRLVMLRDPKLLETSDETLEQLAGAIKDNNYRIFAERGEVHVVSAGLHLSSPDPFLLMERLLRPGFGGTNDTHQPAQLDASHAFYLGFEMCKAATALTLSKQYRQDEALDWGYLTVEEESHRLRKSNLKANRPSAGGADA
jgi:dihydropteroate synthase-like protein